MPTVKTSEGDASSEEKKRDDDDDGWEIRTDDAALLRRDDATDFEALTRRRLDIMVHRAWTRQTTAATMCPKKGKLWSRDCGHI